MPPITSGSPSARWFKRCFGLARRPEFRRATKARCAQLSRASSAGRASAPPRPKRATVEPLVLGGAGGSRMRCAAGDGFLVAARALGLGLLREVAGLVPARRQLAHLHRAVLRVDAAATTRVPGYDVRTRIAPVAVVHRHGVLDYAPSVALLRAALVEPLAERFS
jgi:hypothetical protein